MRALILAGAVVTALAVTPTAANAAGTVSGGPVRVAGGHSLTLHAVDARKDTLTISVQRGKPSDGESETLVVSAGVRVNVGRGSATIKGTLGRRGSVDLKLRSARRAPRAKLPDGCTGSRGTTHTGRLTGRLKLKLSNGKTVTIRSLSGSTYVGGKLRCESDPQTGGDGEGGDGGDGAGEPQLILSAQGEDETMTFTATKRALMLSRIQPEHKDGRATVTVVRSVYATGSNLLAVADGGARATVNAAGRFSGTGLFTATSSAGRFATGPLTGSLQVRTHALAIAGENAMLMQ